MASQSLPVASMRPSAAARQQCMHSTCSQPIQAHRRLLGCRRRLSSLPTIRGSRLQCRAEQTATGILSCLPSVPLAPADRVCCSLIDLTLFWSCAEETRPLVSAKPAQSDGGSWVPVLAPEDLPKGGLHARMLLPFPKVDTSPHCSTAKPHAMAPVACLRLCRRAEGGDGQRGQHPAVLVPQ